MSLRTATLRSVVALLALVGPAWFATLTPTAAWTVAPVQPAPWAGDLLAGSSGQPGDPDAG